MRWLALMPLFALLTACSMTGAAVESASGSGLAILVGIGIAAAVIRKHKDTDDH